MRKHFSYFLAMRYLIPKGTFVIIINAISIMGVCLGVAIMIVVLSVMKGFENEFQRSLLGFEPHLTAIDESGQEGDPANPAYLRIGEMLEKVPGVVSQSPFVWGQVMVRHGDRYQVPFMKAILPTDQQLKELKEKNMLQAGTLDLEPKMDEQGNFFEPVIISRSLADSFRRDDGQPLQIGDVITMYSPVDMEKVLKEFDENQADDAPNKQDTRAALEQAMAPIEVAITAIVDSPMYQQFIIPSLRVGQDLVGFDETGRVNGLAVFTEDPKEIEQVKTAALQALPISWRALSWIDTNRPRLDAIRMERSLISVLLFFIIVVAAFCIMNTIIVTTMQKRREIGVMKAIGAQTGQIVRVFVYQGLIVGLLGTLTGIAIGLLLVHNLESIRSLLSMLGTDPFPENIYGLAKLPVEVIPGSILVIAISAVVTCTLASIPPAWTVARMDAARALRD